MKFTYEDYRESAAYLTGVTDGHRPEILMILGSGLGFMGELCESPLFIPYGDIPHFGVSTAPGHTGRLVFGTLCGKRVAIMQGRTHYYEGRSYEETAYAVRVLRLMGADTLIVTNATGSVNTEFAPGDLVLIDDHIKFFDESPLRGPNIEEFGPRFSDMSYVYTPELRRLAKKTAGDCGIPLRNGVYMYFPGPQYETPAEIRAARALGADLVGMSTVPETITAAHTGMRVLGISLVTNMAAGVLDKPLTMEEVLLTAEAGKEKFSTLITEILKRM